MERGIQFVRLTVAVDAKGPARQAKLSDGPLDLRHALRC